MDTYTHEYSCEHTKPLWKDKDISSRKAGSAEATSLVKDRNESDLKLGCHCTHFGPFKSYTIYTKNKQFYKMHESTKNILPGTPPPFRE